MPWSLNVAGIRRILWRMSPLPATDVKHRKKYRCFFGNNVFILSDESGVTNYRDTQGKALIKRDRGVVIHKPKRTRKQLNQHIPAARFEHLPAVARSNARKETSGPDKVTSRGGGWYRRTKKTSCRAMQALARHIEQDL